MNKRQITIGLFVLLAGSVVYLVDRPPQATWFVQALPFHASLHAQFGGFLGSLGKFLPAFVHVFALAVITGGILENGRIGRMVACLSWLVIDLAFELGQKFPEQAAALVPGWFSAIPIFNQTTRYFYSGSYHPLDMAATVLGAMAAYGVLVLTEQSRKDISLKSTNLTQKKEEIWT